MRARQLTYGISYACRKEEECKDKNLEVEKPSQDRLSAFTSCENLPLTRHKHSNNHSFTRVGLPIRIVFRPFMT